MNDLTVLEYQNIRVLTTQQLADAYETEPNNIIKNFERNRDRFVEGRDYYLLQGEELKAFKDCMTNGHVVSKHTPSLYLWTERGANRHCKILDTDKAWQQFDVLEETYFNVRKKAEIDITKLSPEMHMFKLIYDSVAKTQIESAAAKTIALESKERIEQVQEQFNTVKEAITNRDVNWREYINTTINKIVDKIGGRDYQTFRADTYKLLEQRAGCDLSTRLRNLKARLEERGATKSAINAITKMDIIEEDKKIKEIYNTIIRELAVKYLA